MDAEAMCAGRSGRDGDGVWGGDAGFRVWESEESEETLSEGSD